MPTDFQYSECAFEIVRDIGNRATVTWEEMVGVIQSYCSQYTVKIPVDDTERQYWFGRITDYTWPMLSADQFQFYADLVDPLLREMNDKAEEERDEGILDGLWTKLQEGLDWLLTQLEGFLAGIFDAVGWALDGIENKLTLWFDPQTGIIPTLIRDGLGAITSLFDLETGPIGSRISRTLDSVNSIGDSITGLIDSILEFPAMLGDAVESLAGSILERINTVINGIVNAVKAALGAAYDWVAGKLEAAIQTMIDGLGNAYDWVMASLETAVDVVGTFIADKISDVATWYVNILEDVKQYVLDLAEGIYTDITTVFDVVADELSSISDSLHTEVMELVNGFDGMFDNFKVWVDDLLTIDTEKLPGIMSAMSQAMEAGLVPVTE